MENNTPNKFAKVGRFKTVRGSVLNPENAGLRFVLTFLGLDGKPSDPLYTHLDKKWSKVKVEARGWFASQVNYKLGNTHTIAVQSDTWVIPCLVKKADGSVDTAAVVEAFKKVATTALYEKATVHVSSMLLLDLPELGDYLQKHLLDKGVSVNFYDET